MLTRVYSSRECSIWVPLKCSKIMLHVSLEISLKSLQYEGNSKCLFLYFIQFQYYILTRVHSTRECSMWVPLKCPKIMHLGPVKVSLKLLQYEGNSKFSFF